MECDAIFSVGVYKPTQLRLSKSYLNMMSNKRKRNTLSLADKYEVIKLLDQKMMQTQTANITSGLFSMHHIMNTKLSASFYEFIE